MRFAAMLPTVSCGSTITAASGPHYTSALSPGIPGYLFPADEPEGVGEGSLPESKFHPQGDLTSIEVET